MSVGSAPDRAEPSYELYLALLKGTLTRLLFDEAPSRVYPREGWRHRVYSALDRHVLSPRGWQIVKHDRSRRHLREDGFDHPADAETMVGLKRLDNLQHCIEQVVADGVPGDVLEAGVWRGGASIFMEAVLVAHGATDRTLWVCDSFAGLPPPNPEQYPADAGDTFHTEQFLAVSQEEVRRNFERYGLLRDNVRFVEGLFQDTFPVLDVDRLAVLRADGDMYESTVAILDNLYDKVSPGGFVIIDDYGAIDACRQATDDFRARRGIDDPMVQIDWTGWYWRRS